VTVLADTGAVYALLDRDDAWHERVAAWWARSTGPVHLPVTVLPEIAWLLGSRIGADAERAFGRALALGEFVVEHLDEEDFPRIADLMDRYGDLPLGLVDASLVALAERLEADTLLTTDRRHFTVVRPAHRSSFRLAP
jgi:predicted nucleic acid-binding protein